MMWIEVDLAGIMRAVPAYLPRRIQRVSDNDMMAIKAAVESATRQGAEVLGGAERHERDATGLEDHTVTQGDSYTRAPHRDLPRKARHYDLTSRLYPRPATPSALSASGLSKRSSFARMLR